MNTFGYNLVRMLEYQYELFKSGKINITCKLLKLIE